MEHTNAGPDLIKAVRGLEKGASIPETLPEIWRILSEGACESNPATEKLLFMILVKNMSGPNGEQARRYPLTWNILGALFSRISAYSIVKILSLAGFTDILRETLKGLSSPKADISGSAIRDSSSTAAFDLESQREAQGCLRSAEAVLPALGNLFSRCETVTADDVMAGVGPEHVKSLFCMLPWKEFREMLQALLAICNLAIRSGKIYKDQASWISTIVALWDLHQRVEDESLEAANFMSTSCIRLLQKLSSSSAESATPADEDVRREWTQDIRQFLVRNLIFPIRANFFENGGLENIDMILSLLGTSTESLPILLDVAIWAPTPRFVQNIKTKNQAWIQEVFESIEKALRRTSDARKHAVMQEMLEILRQNGTPLSTKTLRLVCEKYALQPGSTDWSILLGVIKLDADVFLVSRGKHDLLGEVLRQTGDLEDVDEDAFQKASEFVVSLAKGFAVGRDLLGFLQRWLENLASRELHLRPDSPRNVWTQGGLATTVADIIRTPMNVTQLREILEWIKSQTTAAHTAGSMPILEAVCRGVAQAAFDDSITKALFTIAVSEQSLPDTTSPNILASQWTLVELALPWASAEEIEQVWPRIGQYLQRNLGETPVGREDTFAAFKCSVAAWLTNYPGGKVEDEAARVCRSFLAKLCEGGDIPSPSKNAPISKNDYFEWIRQGPSRLLSMVRQSDDKLSDILLKRLVSETTKLLPTEDSSSLKTDSLVPVHSVLENESNVDNRQIMEDLLGEMIDLVQKGGWTFRSNDIATTALLEMPSETFDSESRQKIAQAVLQSFPKSAPVDILSSKRNLSLLIRVLEEPTFYQNMSFGDLDSIARQLVSNVSKETWSEDDLLGVQDAMLLLEEVAALTLRRMTRNTKKREQEYIKDAVRLIQTGWQQPSFLELPRILLLKSIVASVLPHAKSLSIDTSSLKELLISIQNTYLLEFLTSWAEKSNRWKTYPLLSLLTALSVLDVMDKDLVAESIRSAVPDLVAASEELVKGGYKAGWEIRIFLANHFHDQFKSPLDLVQISAREDDAGSVGDDPLALPRVDKDTIVKFFDLVVRHTDEAARLGCLQQLLAVEATEGRIYQLWIIYLLILHIKDTRPITGDGVAAGFDLALAHHQLCERLLETRKPEEFVLVAQIVHTLLTQKSTCMDQGNLERTLGTVSIISATLSSRQLVKPRVYGELCSLVHVLVARHRKRLHGRFHLLVTALQSLLQCLIAHPALWAKHAKSYARLLTLLCEPTATALGGRSADRSAALESERDEARRYAGQYMYLVLMQYVKLLFDHRAPLSMREALEPGMHAIFDVTSKERLRKMNDAMDKSDRVLMKELFLRYEKFGKWTGV